MDARKLARSCINYITSNCIIYYDSWILIVRMLYRSYSDHCIMEFQQTTIDIYLCIFYVFLQVVLYHLLVPKHANKIDWDDNSTSEKLTQNVLIWSIRSVRQLEHTWSATNNNSTWNIITGRFKCVPVLFTRWKNWARKYIVTSTICASSELLGAIISVQIMLSLRNQIWKIV